MTKRQKCNDRPPICEISVNHVYHCQGCCHHYICVLGSRRYSMNVIHSSSRSSSSMRFWRKTNGGLTSKTNQVVLSCQVGHQSGSLP
jgi:hypothetical protein